MPRCLLTNGHLTAGECGPEGEAQSFPLVAQILRVEDGKIEATKLLSSHGGPMIRQLRPTFSPTLSLQLDHLKRSVDLVLSSKVKPWLFGIQTLQKMVLGIPGPLLPC